MKPRREPNRIVSVGAALATAARKAFPDSNETYGRDELDAVALALLRQVLRAREKGHR